MLIDMDKLIGKKPINYSEATKELRSAKKEILEALHTMRSTVEFFDDQTMLKINKDRMIKFLTKYIE